MSTATGPLSCWCAGRRRTGNGRKILYIPYIQSKSRFGPPRRLFLGGVRCKVGGRGNRRSAASGGCSETISRKCPDWRTRQWPSVGWHDGGQENPAPTECNKRCGGAGRCGHRPLRNRIMGCVGEGLCPSHGRGRTPPLRRGHKKCGWRADRGIRPYDIIPVFLPPPSLFFP